MIFLLHNPLKIVLSNGHTFSWIYITLYFWSTWFLVGCFSNNWLCLAWYLSCMRSCGGTEQTCCSPACSFFAVVWNCLGFSKQHPCPYLHIGSPFLLLSALASLPHYSSLRDYFSEVIWSCYMAITSQFPLLNHHQEVCIKSNVISDYLADLLICYVVSTMMPIIFL